MKFIKYLSIIFLFLHAETVKVAYPSGSWPPLSYLILDKLHGASKDLVSDIFSNLNLDVEYYPYNNFDDLDYYIRNDFVDAVMVSTFYNNIDGNVLKVKPAYFTDSVSVLIKDDFQNGFSWQHLQGRLGAILHLDQVGSLVDKYNQGFLSFHEIYDAENALDNLIQSKVDYIMASKSSLEMILQKSPKDTSDIKIYDLEELELYIGFCKDSKYKVYEPFVTSKISNMQDSGLFGGYVSFHVDKYLGS